MTEIAKKQAQQVYQTLCAALDDRKWKYGKEEANLLVHFNATGNSLPIHCVIFVDEERQLLRVVSPLAEKFSEKKRIEGAIAVAAANYGMADGGFDYDITDGQLGFRMSMSIRESVIGKELIHYLINCTCSMVDRYSADFLALEKGYISLEEFLSKAS